MDITALKKEWSILDNGVAVGANTDSFGGLAIGAFYLLGLQFFALYNLSILAKELKGGPNGVHFVEEAPQHVQWFFTRLRQHHRRWGILIFYIDTRVRDQVSPTILESTLYHCTDVLSLAGFLVFLRQISRSILH